MEAEYIRSTRPATAKTAADGSTVAAARSRPSTAHTAAANANAYSYSRPQTGRTAATGASASASRSRPQTTKSLRSGSGESGLGASASDGEQDGGAAGARRDGVGKLSQMQERTRQKAHVRHQVLWRLLPNWLRRTHVIQLLVRYVTQRLTCVAQ